MDIILGKKSENEALPVLTFSASSIESKEDSSDRIIQCVKCTKAHKFPEEKDDYLAHLFLEHRLIIADIDEIPLLEDYLRFWQKELQECELEQFCTTMLLDQLPDGTAAKNEKYYLLSDILPKDYELRRTLQQQSLEKALAQHQYERSDRNFCKECLYCRDVIKGLRADYLKHLFNKHFLQLGKPENLVYVDELLAKVQNNLEQLICLYCDKVFKDRITLKEHMRKKAHKRINPSSREYDKYFLQNYRNKQAPSTRATQQVTKKIEPQAKTTNKDFERRLVNSDDSDSDWSDWDDEKQAPLNCLYCSQQHMLFKELKDHMLTAHHVNFEVATKELNFYQKIKIINYVRRQMCLLRCVACNLRCESIELLLEHMSNEQHFGLGTQKQWDKPEYFFPTYEDDGLLCILDDGTNDDIDDTVVRIISEDSLAQINKDAERLSLENFKFF